MNELALSAISLFSGVGMLDEGLRAGLAHLGIAHRTICHVEREAHAAAVLVARMEEGSLDAAPIWPDVTTFDAAVWRGKVDFIVAGFPCQDLSIAGKRAGLDGKRSGLFFEVCRIAADCEAQFLFLENVAGIASATASVMDATEGELDERAASRVVGELADLGWDAEWLHLSASDVGASHGRARWFCLAWRMADASRDVGHGNGDREDGSRRRVCEAGNALDDSSRAERWTACIGGIGSQQGHDGGWTEADGRVGVADKVLGVATGYRRNQGIPESSGEQGRSDVAESGLSVADAGSTGLQERIGGGSNDKPFQQAIRPEPGSLYRTFGLFAPGPSDPRWAGILGQHPELAPALEPTFRGVVNGLAFDMGDSRAARLKCAGNGVVPATAGCAFVILARRTNRA
ncbi:MAG TPA: DNA cytosine methyltransferase [Terracidiphilus sp.]|nr:DNA cytosine methyltransferase [Terracidiphilus sp.]